MWQGNYRGKDTLHLLPLLLAYPSRKHLQPQHSGLREAGEIIKLPHCCLQWTSPSSSRRSHTTRQAVCRGVTKKIQEQSGSKTKNQTIGRLSTYCYTRSSEGVSIRKKEQYLQDSRKGKEKVVIEWKRYKL